MHPRFEKKKKADEVSRIQCTGALGLYQAVSLTGIARVGCPEKSILFIFSDDVAETFTEDPSKSVRIGVLTYCHWGQKGLRMMVTHRAAFCPP